MLSDIPILGNTNRFRLLDSCKLLRPISRDGQVLLYQQRHSGGYPRVDPKTFDEGPPLGWGFEQNKPTGIAGRRPSQLQRLFSVGEVDMRAIRHHWYDARRSFRLFRTQSMPPAWTCMRSWRMSCTPRVLSSRPIMLARRRRSRPQSRIGRKRKGAVRGVVAGTDQRQERVCVRLSLG